MNIFRVCLTTCLFVIHSLLARYHQISSCIQANYTGIYTLNVNGTRANVICDSTTDWGGWTTIINRINDQTVNFNLKWDILAHQGAGSVIGDYLLPLDLVHLITNSEPHQLLVQLSDGIQTGWAFYSYFKILSEHQNFQLIVSDYDQLSTAGDSFLSSNETFFSTSDRDNDFSLHKSCAQKYRSPGWFQNCYYANPLGDYSPSLHSIAWYSFNPNIKKQSLYSLTFKIRPRHCASRGSGTQCRTCDPSYRLVRSNTSNSVLCLPLCNSANPSCALCSFSSYCHECNSGYTLNNGHCELDATQISNNFISITETSKQNYFPQGLILFIIAIGPYLLANCLSQSKTQRKSNKSQSNKPNSKSNNPTYLDNCFKRFVAALLLNECCYRANSHQIFSYLIPFSLMIQILRVSLGLLLYNLFQWQALVISTLLSIFPLGYRCCLKSKIRLYAYREENSVTRKESKENLSLDQVARFESVVTNQISGSEEYDNSGNEKLFNTGALKYLVILALFLSSGASLLYYIYYTRDLDLDSAAFWLTILFSYIQQILQILIYGLVNSCCFLDIRSDNNVIRINTGSGSPVNRPTSVSPNLALK